MAAKTSLRGKVKNIFSGNKNNAGKAAVQSMQNGVSVLLSNTYKPIEQRSATDGWATNKMITPAKFDMSKAMDMIKPNPKYNAQVGTGAVAPMPKIPMLNAGIKDNTLAMAALNGANALFSGGGTKPKTGGGGQAPVAPATPPTPVSPLQDTVDRLLSRAGYASSYKPKKDSLANTQKDQNNRYLAMYGPFKSIE